MKQTPVLHSADRNPLNAQVIARYLPKPPKLLRKDPQLEAEVFCSCEQYTADLAANHSFTQLSTTRESPHRRTDTSCYAITDLNQ